MNTYIQSIIVLVCFIIGTHAFASNYKEETTSIPPLTIPQLSGGFDISISALFMTPSSSNLDYLGVHLEPTDSDLIYPHDYMLNYDISPNNNWGFILDLGYVFPNTANDVRLDWMAFHSNYSNHYDVFGQNGMLTNVVFYPIEDVALLADTDFATALATINYKLDTLDLTFGQYLNLFQRLQTRLFTGLRYARVYSEMTTLYTSNWDTDTSLPTGGTFSGNMTSSFNGLGPLIGTRADLAIGKGLGLTASFDLALLTGNLGLKANQLIKEVELDALTVTRNTFNWGTQKVIAAALDTKFGLNYQYQFNNGTQLIGELGYQVSQYFDVIEQIDRDSTTLDSYLSTDVTNFDLRGPYLTLRVKV